MITQKQKAAGLTATSRQLQKVIESYKQSERLSSAIDQLLAGLLFGLQYPHLSPPERATVLDCLDGLLRLKIDIRQGKGVRRAV